MTASELLTWAVTIVVAYIILDWFGVIDAVRDLFGRRRR